jgi:hypothetical protein
MVALQGLLPICCSSLLLLLLLIIIIWLCVWQGGKIKLKRRWNRRKWWKVLSTLLTLLKLCLIGSISCIGTLAEDCLQPLTEFLHLASSAIPRAGRLRNVPMSMGAPRPLTSYSWLGLLYLIDSVDPVLRKIKSSDPLNHEHKVRA